MNFSEVIQMRIDGGPFAGAMFLIVWFFTKTWMLWVGIFIGILLNRFSKNENERSK